MVEYELGRGGMGAVYAVVHEAIGKRAALKVVHNGLTVLGFNSDRMLQEAKVVNQVGHPNIVDIFETGKLPDGRPYIVMERLSGRALSTRADQCKMTPEFVIAVLLQVCDALIAAHAAGVVHRDLKLDNVFLADNPEDPAMPKVKLLDWGIAKVINDDAKYTIEGQLVGTPQYLAPEQARGQVVSPKTDVYSLGVMAYELFLDQPPFEAETAAEVIAMHLRLAPPLPCALWPEIPPALHDLLLAMLAKQPDQRPTVLEVISQLEAVRDELARRHALTSSRYPTATALETVIPDPARPADPAPAEPSTLRSRRKPWRYAIGALALGTSAIVVLARRADGEATNAGATAGEFAASEVDRKLAPPVANPPGADAAPREPHPISPDLETRPGPALEPAAAPAQRPSDPGPVATRTTRPPAPSSPPSRGPAFPTGSISARAKPARDPAVAPSVRVTVDPGARSNARVDLRDAVPPPQRPPLDPDGTLDPYR